MAELNTNSNYELAYHLNPDLEEAELKVQADEISNLITQYGGAIINSKAPQKTHLSYQIKNKQYANFGVIEFKLSAESVEKLSSQIKLQNSVMRFLIIKKPADSKELRILGQHRSRARTKTHETGLHEVPKTPAKEKTPEEKAKLEQDIEKVIEGL